MSNSTQNKPFNDLPAKNQKDIIRGAMKHAKKLQDEVLQNDWESQFDLFVSYLDDNGDDCQDWIVPPERIRIFIRKLLADARKEVIEKVEKRWLWTKKTNLFSYREIESYKEGYDKAMEHVLATLKEEGV